MRAIMSPSGSFNAIVPGSLPARLDYGRDQPLGAECPHGEAAGLVFAMEAAWAARQFAAIADAGRVRIARQFGQLQRGREAFLHRLALIARDCLEPRAASRELLRHLAASVVLL